MNVNLLRCIAEISIAFGNPETRQPSRPRIGLGLTEKQKQQVNKSRKRYFKNLESQDLIKKSQADFCIEMGTFLYEAIKKNKILNKNPQEAIPDACYAIEETWIYESFNMKKKNMIALVNKAIKFAIEQHE